MSTWTHVAAVIRIDCLRLSGLPGNNIDLGFPVKFGDPPERWKQCTVPCGSEGSLEHFVHENPHKNDTAAYVVTIWGDLRDYDNVDEIIKYLNRVTSDQMIRQGTAEIRVGRNNPVHMHYDHGKEMWVQH